MIFPVVFLIALITVLLISPSVKQFGIQFGLVDQPDARKLHHQVMVRSGGVGIAIGTMVAIVVGLGWQAVTISVASTHLSVLGALVAGTGFFGIGLADDRWSLSPKLRLGFQAIVTLLAWMMGLQIHHLPIPGVGTVALGLYSLPITFLWLAGITNAINWLDGLDGLAAGISLISAITFALIGWQQGNAAIVLLALALAGAALGFLRYNAMPAQMYMGDGGSYFIGGMLAGLGILITGSSAAFNLNAMPYAILALPIIDMVLVILSRGFDGKSPFFPDQRHLHHRLLRIQFQPAVAVFTIYGLTAWSGLTAMLLLEEAVWGWVNLVSLAWVITFVNRTALKTAATPLTTTIKTSKALDPFSSEA